MKHNIKHIEYFYSDDCGVRIIIDGTCLFYDGTYTFNCIEEILQALGIDYEIEFLSEYEKTTFITKPMQYEKKQFSEQEEDTSE